MSTRDELADAIDQADHEYTLAATASRPLDTVANHIADALIAEGWRKKPSRDEIADEISGVVVGDGYYSTQIGRDAALESADAILALMDRGQ